MPFKIAGSFLLFYFTNLDDMAEKLQEELQCRILPHLPDVIETVGRLVSGYDTSMNFSDAWNFQYAVSGK